MFISKKNYNKLVKQIDTWQHLAEATQKLNNKAIEVNSKILKALSDLEEENAQLKAQLKKPCSWCGQPIRKE